MTQPATLRWAVRAYDAVVRRWGGHALAPCRAELVQTFEEVCVAALERGGSIALVRRAVTELWDLFRTGLLARVGLAGRVTATRSRRPRLPRSWALATDVRHAVRALMARRADTLLCVMLLVLGLATASTIFGVVDSLLLDPVPFRQPNRLVQLWSTQAGSNFATPSMPRDLVPHWLDRHDLFVSGGASMPTSALITGPGGPEVLPASYLSPGLLETLGARPILGRTFAPEEGEAGTDRVVIISDDVWAKRFGRAPDAIGRRLHINDTDYTVIGIMAADFRFPYERQRLWLPISLTAPPPRLANMFTMVTARLQPTVTPGHVKEAVEAAAPGIAAQALRPWRYGASAHFLGQTTMDDTTRRSIWVLFGATTLLLLIVCINIANIGLAQVFARTRDAAIRSALGASRLRLIRHMLVEQLGVGLFALAVALPLAAAGLRLAHALVPAGFTFSSLHVIAFDARVAALTFALALIAPITAGLAPAVAGSRADVLYALRLESRSSTSTRGARLFRQALVVTEVAGSVVLLLSAALLVRSFVRMQHADMGFDSHNLVSVNLGFPTAQFASGVSRDLYVDRAVEAIGRLPGVLAVTAATGVPPENGFLSFGSVEVEGQNQEYRDRMFSGYDVRPEFFSIIGVPLRAGRRFAADDDATRVIVSDTFASMFWPGRSAIGKRFRWADDGPGAGAGEQWREVVGVVGAIRETIDAARQTPQIYQRLERHTPGPVVPSRDAIAGYMRLAVRVADPAAVIPAIRGVLRETDAAILVSAVERVDDQLAHDLDRPRFLLALMIVFAGVGLMLAAAGVYGVLSCLVSQQLHEIGVRVMLGADPRRLARAIINGGLATVSVGLAIGMIGAAVLGRGLGSLLFQIEPHDPTSFVAVAVVLLAVGVASAWRPARRATRVDPMTLLRNQ